MNKVLLIGNLGKAADLSASKNGKSVAKFTLAINRGKDAQGEDMGTDWVSCVAFGKTADNMDRYTTKGSKLAVEGHIRVDTYTNNEGKSRTSVEVIADRVEFLNKVVERDADAPQAPAPEGFNKLEDDDIPF